MPPPPPPENDAGFSKDALESQLSEIGSSDNKRSALISSVIENFDEADSDGDGKVSFKEAMAYDHQSSDTTSANAGESAATTQASEVDVMRQILQLMQAYQVFGSEEGETGLDSLLTTTA